ncbi:HupE/UreJ family protein [Vibrio sp. SS-MA-C1-2]|uniref:HupE/UreJ family protein n=1 Tax=Vibrio sp. SS-MA-C1-2 TaxID=2908646 RepID=UPI001F2CA457|nr:HupE/UreJ family protein [Vibrio sp. SS-MA-C1-2]UJF17817.1 HupE/UreJ family protein [Vibrio sp. SS-MA-C1-2]
MLVAFGVLIMVALPSTKKRIAVAGLGIFSLLIGLISGQIFGFSSVTEPAILVSLLVVSIALWYCFSTHESFKGVMLITTFSMLFFHGYAHGVEATHGVSVFGFGMLISATLLIGLGCWLKETVYSKWLPITVSSLTAFLMLTA